MSGGKGPSQSGNIMQTVSNKTNDTLLPYQQGGWDAARYTFDNNPTPAAIAEGYDKQYDIAKNYSADLTGAATGSLKDALYGGMGVGSSPSYGALSDLQSGVGGHYGTVQNGAFGTSITGDQLKGLAYAPDSNYTAGAGALGQLATGMPDPSFSGGVSSLAKTANGDYLNSNPYLDRTYDAAARGVTRAYQTATAPQADSTYELSGRYGSGAHGSAVSQNQQDLGVSLDDLATSIYGKNYATERGYQNTAAKDLGNLGLGEQASRTTAANNLGALGQGQQRLQGSILDSAGGQYKNSGNLGLGALTAQTGAANDLLTGFSAGNANQNTALGLYPATQKETFYPATQMTAAGQGLQMEPYGNVAEYLKLLGNPATGSSSTTTPVLGPNGLTSALGTAGSALTLGNGIADAGLFGGGKGIGGWPIVAGLGGL